MKNPISIYKSVISKLIYIYVRFVSFQKSNRIFYTCISHGVSRNEYLFLLLKKIFTQFFDGSPIQRRCSQRPSIRTLHNLRLVSALIGAENKEAILENTLAGSRAGGKNK